MRRPFPCRCLVLTMIVAGFVCAARIPAQEPKKPDQPTLKDELEKLAKPKNRDKRMGRWVVNFNTKDAEDYLKQLDACGAILGVPDADGKLMVIRDLKMRPAK